MIPGSNDLEAGCLNIFFMISSILPRVFHDTRRTVGLGSTDL